MALGLGLGLPFGGGGDVTPPTPSIPVITGLPTISGDEYVTGVLTATRASVSGIPVPTPTGQWIRTGVDIPGEVADTYVLVAADEGETITFRQVETNTEGSDDATSLPTGVIQPEPVGPAVPVITGVPTISGTETVGQTLTATPASVTGTPTPDLTWQWERAGSPISGATSITYLLVAADEGQTLTVVQTETNTEGFDTAESVATGVIQPESTGPDYSANGFDPATVLNFAGLDNAAVEDFIEAGAPSTYDSMVTFSRAGNATMVDSDGLLKWAPHSALLNSIVGGPGWANSARVSVTLGQPDRKGGTEATLIETVSIADPVTGENSVGYEAGVRVALECELYAGVSSKGGLDLYSITGFHRSWYTFDLLAGTFEAKQTDLIDCAAEMENLGDGWWRCKVAGTLVVSTQNMLCSIRAGDNAAYQIGDTVRAAFPRVHRDDLGGMVDNPDTGDSYVPTTGTAVFLPRRNHHYWNGAEYVNDGVRLETALATNVCTHSINCASLAENATGTDNATTSRGVGLTEFVEDTASGTHGAKRLFNFTAGEDVAMAAVCTAGVGTRFLTLGVAELGVGFHATFNVATGAVTESIGIGAGTLNYAYSREVEAGVFEFLVGGVSPNTGAGNFRWTLSDTATPGGLALPSYFGDGTSSLNIGQLFAGEVFVAPELIPTNGTEVTRVAEVADIDYDAIDYGTGQFSLRIDAAIRPLVDGDYVYDQGFCSVYSDNNNTATLQVYTGGNSNFIWGVGRFSSTLYSVNQRIDTGVTFGDDLEKSMAYRLAAGDYQIAVGGVSAIEDTGVTYVHATPDLRLGEGFQINRSFNGTIRLVAVWGEDIGQAGIEEASS